MQDNTECICALLYVNYARGGKNAMLTQLNKTKNYNSTIVTLIKGARSQNKSLKLAHTGLEQLRVTYNNTLCQKQRYQYGTSLNVSKCSA